MAVQNPVAAFLRLLGWLWVLARHDALIPREANPLLPVWARPFARAVQMLSGRDGRQGRPGQRLGKAFEHLGPVAIKLGQVLATRADIFGLQFARDLGRLKDALPPFPLEEARREIETRYDLKGSKNEVTLEKTDITILAADDMKLKAVVDILQSRLHKRGVPLKALTYGRVEQASGGALRQTIALQQGIPIEKAREIVRLVKDTKLKVQAAIQEDHVRVSGKNRDDLQKVIALLKDKDFGIAIQFTNYRSA